MNSKMPSDSIPIAETSEESIRADERAKVIDEILSLGCEACGILLAECGRCQDIRALLKDRS